MTLDEACRRQQLGEGWFPSLDAVPDARHLHEHPPDPQEPALIVCRARRAQGPGGPGGRRGRRSRRTIRRRSCSGTTTARSTSIRRPPRLLRRRGSPEPSGMRSAGLVRSSGQRVRRRRFQRRDDRRRGARPCAGGDARDRRDVLPADPHHGAAPTISRARFAALDRAVRAKPARPDHGAGLSSRRPVPQSGRGLCRLPSRPTP